jgi:hypothetical protein
VIRLQKEAVFCNTDLGYLFLIVYIPHDILREEGSSIEGGVHGMEIYDLDYFRR